MRQAKKRSADHTIGRSREGLNSRFYVVVDARGLLVHVVVTQGQASEETAVPALIDGLPPAQISALAGATTPKLLSRSSPHMACALKP